MTAEIFNVTKENFVSKALDVFQYQWNNNSLYNKYCRLRNIERQDVTDITHLPFLPVEFFKSHKVVSFTGQEEMIFSSSGTTGMNASRHFVKSLDLYEQSFSSGFSHFYGDPRQYAFLCLLPSYLERTGSSLIYMADQLIKMSGNPDSGFFLKATGALSEILSRREKLGLRTFLLGVTFALLDFAESTFLRLNHTIIMETGGMKGRREELTRLQVHDLLIKAFHVEAIHSEYGMTELLSQAYSKGMGRFTCPPWMKVLVRKEDDPFYVSTTGTGMLCIIDLANVHSCAFIESSDLGRVYEDGSFEVLGRMDNSDIRGCSLLVL
ncbi:MAG: acyl transferase [Bacteroidota bacterium]